MNHRLFPSDDHVAFLADKSWVYAAEFVADRLTPRADKISRSMVATLAFCARLPNKLSYRDRYDGEGRCPVVPLVFKTSLGAVRSPEGSTPSLLRQKSSAGALIKFRKGDARPFGNPM